MIEQFKQFLPAFDFASRAFDELEKLQSDEFHFPRNPKVKKLVEEILPIATFAKTIEGPQARFEVLFVGDEKRYDGEMKASGSTVNTGFLKPHYHVEVTSAVSDYEHLQRESLAKHGSVFGGPNIERTGSKSRGNADVVSSPSVRDFGAEVEETKSWVKKAIEGKSATNYPSPCFLLVRVEPETNFSLGEWAELIKWARENCANPNFEAVYLIHTSTLAVHLVFRAKQSYEITTLLESST